MDSEGCCWKETWEALDRVAPGKPLLALGQTVFWDEAMKAGVALKGIEAGRKFVAGVHDTDYFAKFVDPGGATGVKALPHNDTTTKNLWSAAGEFSCLFGSETVVEREMLTSAGGKVKKVEDAREGFLDEITEAWGWRGVVSLSKESRITAEKKLARVFPELFKTFQWAIEESLRLVSGEHRKDSDVMAARLLQTVCDARDDMQGESLAEYYRRLLPEMFAVTVGQEVPMETTQTTELLRLNRKTAGLARFDVVRLFLDPVTRGVAESAYNDAVRGSEIYTLDRFGAGAMPFDLFVPGYGRGTLRLGTRGGVVMAENPFGFSYKKRPTTVQELAGILEDKFGDGVVLVGKAVTLILMLAREFVFVFHDGASGYVHRSGDMARRLGAAGHVLDLSPILRVRYEPWDAMDDCCAWLKLPEPLARPFGTDELSAPSFARRWREVAANSRVRLAEMKGLRRPLELVRYLDKAMGGNWSCLAAEYEGMQKDVEQLARDLNEVKVAKQEVLGEMRALKCQRNLLEHAKGVHWRSELFERDAREGAWEERAGFEDQIESVDLELKKLKERFAGLSARQEEIVSTEDVKRVRRRRSAIGLEAEMMRLRLIREAVMATKGLEHAGHRPAAWWFPLVCPGGSWYESTLAQSTVWLEPLT